MRLNSIIKARFKDMQIDFEALAQHLIALKKAAATHHSEIELVIFETEFQNFYLPHQVEKFST